MFRIAWDLVLLAQLAVYFDISTAHFFIIENFNIIIKKLYNNELKITYGPPERRYVQQAAPT